MATSVMTSGDPERQNCFRFVLLLQVQFAQKVCDRSSPFFLQLAGLPAWIIAAKLGSDPSRGVATGTDHSSTAVAEPNSKNCVKIRPAEVEIIGLTEIV